MITYVAKYGDWLAKIASDHGSTVGAIWNHPANAGHAAKRGSPDVLYPGDVLHIPVDGEVVPATPPEEPPGSKGEPPAKKPAEIVGDWLNILFRKQHERAKQQGYVPEMLGKIQDLFKTKPGDLATPPVAVPPGVIPKALKDLFKTKPDDLTAPPVAVPPGVIPKALKDLFKVGRKDTPASLPTWACPGGTCVCHPVDGIVEKVRHVLIVHDGGGAKLANAHVLVVEGDEVLTDTRTNGAGEVELELEPTTRSLLVAWAPEDLPPEPALPYVKRYDVDVSLTPVRTRLANLGFGGRPRLEENVRDFQRAFGHEPSGKPDDIIEDLRRKHDRGTLEPFATQPTLTGVVAPGDGAVAALLRDPAHVQQAFSPPAGRVPAIPQEQALRDDEPEPVGQGALVPDVGHVWVVVGLEPAGAIQAKDVTVRLVQDDIYAEPDAVPRMVRPTVEGASWGVLPAPYLLFVFTEVPAGSYAVVGHVGGLKDVSRGYALGRADVNVTVGLTALSYLPLQRDRPILTVADPLLELDVEPMQRRRKVLATVFVRFPQARKPFKGLGPPPPQFPPYGQGSYKNMVLSDASTCAPINCETMKEAGANPGQFGFKQIVLNEAGNRIVRVPIAFTEFAPGKTPSVGDSFLGVDFMGKFHHCGVVVKASPHFGDLWLTADGGQPDRTSEFTERDGAWMRFYQGDPMSTEAAYIVPRLLMREGGARLGNRFITPGRSLPYGDHVKGWTDVTHPTISFRSAYTDKITDEHFRACRSRIAPIEGRAKVDIERCTLIERMPVEL